MLRVFIPFEQGPRGFLVLAYSCPSAHDEAMSSKGQCSAKDLAERVFERWSDIVVNYSRSRPDLGTKLWVMAKLLPMRSSGIAHGFRSSP